MDGYQYALCVCVCNVYCCELMLDRKRYGMRDNFWKKFQQLSKFEFNWLE